MSEFITISGELHWCRTDKPETDPWGNTKYKATVYPDAESLNKFLDLQARGCRNALKKSDENGKYYVNFSSPDTIKTKKGEVRLDAPLVYQADGVTPLKGLIGNGSKGTVKLEFRTFPLKTGGKGASARLHSIKVDELVPFGDASPPSGDAPAPAGF